MVHFNVDFFLALALAITAGVTSMLCLHSLPSLIYVVTQILLILNSYDNDTSEEMNRTIYLSSCKIILLLLVCIRFQGSYD